MNDDDMCQKVLYLITRLTPKLPYNITAVCVLCLARFILPLRFPYQFLPLLLLGLSVKVEKSKWEVLVESLLWIFIWLSSGLRCCVSYRWVRWLFTSNKAYFDFRRTKKLTSSYHTVVTWWALGFILKGLTWRNMSWHVLLNGLLFREFKITSGHCMGIL